MRHFRRWAGIFTLTVLLCAIFHHASAQETTVYHNEYESYKLGRELFDKEKYSAAQKYFDEVINNFSGQRSEIAISSKYYSALCALELFNENAEFLLINFIRAYPENPKTLFAKFQLGKYWFRKRRYNNAIDWFEEVSVYDLANEDIAEYYFKLGYAYFMEERNEDALKAFYEIKDADTRFTATARYYYAHLSYLAKKYETAIIDFKKIERHPKFSGMVPYYIAQIYFYQKEYDSLLTYAPPLLDSASTKRRPEIARLIGEAYYNKEKYAESIPYLSQYAEENRLTPNESYQLGYAHYKSEKYKEGIQWFEKAINGNDSLNQVSYYHMADCYLKTDNKARARNGMKKAASYTADDEIRENAMFNYAKLAYELSYHPYSDAILAFEDYMNAYPNSMRITDAQEYLIGVYFTTKNYKEALKSLNRIENKNYKLKQAYQKVAYLRGAELYNERNFEGAIEHFELAIDNNYDPNIHASALFWNAEAWHQIFKQDKAISYYKTFLSLPASITHDRHAEAYYGLGYSHYRIKEYDMAIAAFRNFVRVEKKDTEKKNDALIRTGDCYFVNKKYVEAIEYYDKATLMGLLDTDYALFQSAIANGVISSNKEKKSLLLTLIESYQYSPYRDDAIYELGNEYMESDGEKALNYFDELIEDHESSPYVSKAHLKKGLVYFNTGRDEDALASFQTVIKNYRNTDEAAQALDKVRRIYTDRGDLEGFQKFIAGSPELEVNKASLDSAQYEIAENNYMQGKCKEAVKSFTAYLSSDSLGLFEENARFYRAECEYKGGFINEALIDYSYILNKPKSKFYDAALIQASRINYELEKLVEAENMYRKVLKNTDEVTHKNEALVALTDICFQLEKYSDVVEFGKSVLEIKKEQEYVREKTRLRMAKSYQKMDDYNKSYDYFSQVAKSNSEFGVEAKYNVAAIELLRGNLESSEEYIMLAVDQVPAYDYWIAKSLLLLSDVFMEKGELFEAKYTVESVLENYEGEELIEIARGKLQLIKDMEEKKEEEKIKEPEELIIQESDEDYDYLFEEEVFNE